MFDKLGILYRGLALGLMIAAPVGPVGLLCIRRSIQRGLLVGFATGFGAAFADTIFGAIAAFSVAAIVEFLTHYNHFIRIIGGAFLLLAAWHGWHDRLREPQKIPAVEQRIEPLRQRYGATVAYMLKALATGFVITMTNPVTIFAVLAFVATFGGLKDSADATTLVAGIFLGSTLWWLLLSGGVSLVRGHFTEQRIVMINRVTAIALAALAVWAGTSGVAGLFGVGIHPKFFALH